MAPPGKMSPSDGTLITTAAARVKPTRRASAVSAAAAYHRRVQSPGGRMRVDFYGLQFETPSVTFYLWSPWRAAALEHRLFDSLTGLSGVQVEKDADEIR